jgi:hypothetical protein
VNRKLLAIVVVAAVVALVAGAAIGRNMLSSDTSTPKRGTVVHFKDELSKVSIDYPGTWHRVPDNPSQPDLSLLVTAPGDPTTLMLMRITASGLDPVTYASLPVARGYTDDLLAQDPRAKILRRDPVRLGGLAGWRYRYTTGSGDAESAHDHYFLFKNGKPKKGMLVQIVFQATPPERLGELEPTFQRIAGTFKGSAN